MADPDQMTSSNPKTNKEISEGNPPKHGRINVLEQELAEPVEATTEAIKNRGKKRKMTTENDNGKWKADPAKENKKSKKSKKPEEKQLARTRTICSTVSAKVNNHDITPRQIYNWLLHNQTNSNSIVLLGDFISLKIEVNIDKQKAFELYQKAANLGNAYGISSLAYCYEVGNGTNLNKQKAFELYRKAAKLGYKIAQYNLAYMYENGYGGVKDINQAVYWYKKCAEQGDQDAQ
ncbi:HCP-like protein [Rhizophagus irregularis]|uniref:HCP-like protein n=1 Tax=Rhizophagus irregularis TaxID=588596 RepID=A0A2I1GAC8_9GLOM|nr:HCP-like protein [Rhizophagus irregularis]